MAAFHIVCATRALIATGVIQSVSGRWIGKRSLVAVSQQQQSARQLTYVYRRDARKWLRGAAQQSYTLFF
eukprot:6173110-Pleurochrysis_carterae.AAC.3